MSDESDVPLSAVHGCFDCTNRGLLVQSSENVDKQNGLVTDYINFCVDIQTREKELVLCFPKNKLLITKDRKKIINEKFLFASGEGMALKLK